MSASTQNQAFAALLFFFREVLKQPLEDVDALRAKKGKKLPVVMSPREVQQVIQHMHGTTQLMVQLLYGCGLRLNECTRLRIKDLDFDQGLIVIREGKGNKDRITMLPEQLIEPLQQHMKAVQQLHAIDLADGLGSVYLPFSLKKKYPNADKEWKWQYLFPSTKRSKDPRSQQMRRHHVCDKTVQRAVRSAAERAEITKHVTCHTFRHSFATHLLEAGYDIRVIQELLGHKDISTTMIYTHVLQQKKPLVRSPLDLHRPGSD